MLNKNTWDVKSARPIRSSIASQRPKTLISAKAKKLLYQNYFYKYISLASSLGHLCNNIGGQMIKPIIYTLVKICYKVISWP